MLILVSFITCIYFTFYRRFRLCLSCTSKIAMCRLRFIHNSYGACTLLPFVSACLIQPNISTYHFSSTQTLNLNLPLVISTCFTTTKLQSYNLAIVLSRSVTTIHEFYFLSSLQLALITTKHQYYNLVIILASLVTTIHQYISFLLFTYIS